MPLTVITTLATSRVAASCWRILSRSVALAASASLLSSTVATPESMDAVSSVVEIGNALSTTPCWSHWAGPSSSSRTAHPGRVALDANQRTSGIR